MTAFWILFCCSCSAIGGGVLHAWAVGRLAKKEPERFHPSNEAWTPADACRGLTADGECGRPFKHKGACQ